MKKIVLILLLVVLVSSCSTQKKADNLVEIETPEESQINETFIEKVEKPEIIEKNKIELKQEPKKIVFTEHMFELDKVDYIVPLGELEGGWEEREVNNMALVNIKRTGDHGSPSLKMKIYAPTEMSLVFYSYYGYGDYSPTWTLVFEINSDKTLKLSALTDVPDTIKNKVGTEFTKGEIRLQTPLLFNAGDVIGYAGGTAEYRNWDVLFYDKTHTNKFVNQERYEKDYMGERYRTAICAFDLYPDDMRKEYVKFYGFNAPGLTTDCGSASKDVVGTLSGIWHFSKQGLNKEERGDFTSPLFIYNNSAGGTSLGYVNIKRYKIYKDNPTNKDPSEITNEHCYNLVSAWDNSPEGYAFFKLVSDTEMQLATVNKGVCPSNFPNDYETYYR